MSGKFIQNRRKELGMSQRQLADLYGINFRTLQDYEQGRKPVESIKGDVLLRISKALDCSIEDILLEDCNLSDSNKRFLTYTKKIEETNLYGEYYTFPIIINNKCVDLSRVHPLKQCVVSKINEEVSQNVNVIAIMLFGSSITMRCNKDSDIDLAIRLKEDCVSVSAKNEVSEMIQEICDWKADILWFDRLSKNERIYHDICKGVQIV